jgi:hypothetical protein
MRGAPAPNTQRSVLGGLLQLATIRCSCGKHSLLGQPNCSSSRISSKGRANGSSSQHLQEHPMVTVLGLHALSAIEHLVK